MKLKCNDGTIREFFLLTKVESECLECGKKFKDSTEELKSVWKSHMCILPPRVHCPRCGIQQTQTIDPSEDGGVITTCCEHCGIDFDFDQSDFIFYM